MTICIDWCWIVWGLLLLWMLLPCPLLFGF